MGSTDAYRFNPDDPGHEPPWWVLVVFCLAAALAIAWAAS